MKKAVEVLKNYPSANKLQAHSFERRNRKKGMSVTPQNWLRKAFGKVAVFTHIFNNRFFALIHLTAKGASLFS